MSADAFTRVCEFSGVAMVLVYLFSAVLVHHLNKMAKHQKSKKT